MKRNKGLVLSDGFIKVTDKRGMPVESLSEGSPLRPRIARWLRRLATKVDSRPSPIVYGLPACWNKSPCCNHPRREAVNQWASWVEGKR